jgi:hypothetical protein
MSAGAGPSLRFVNVNVSNRQIALSAKTLNWSVGISRRKFHRGSFTPGTLPIFIFVKPPGLVTPQIPARGWFFVSPTNKTLTTAP